MLPPHGMVCPACHRRVEADAWICPFCDHILDSSFLEDSGGSDGPIREERTKVVAWPMPSHQDPPPDAVILGDVSIAEDEFEVVQGAGADRDGRTSTFLYYASGASTRVIHPDAIPRVLASDNSIPRTPYEDFIVSCIDGQRTVRLIQKVSGLAPQEVVVTLLTLMDKGAVAIHTASGAPGTSHLPATPNAEPEPPPPARERSPAPSRSSSALPRTRRPRLASRDEAPRPPVALDDTDERLTTQALELPLVSSPVPRAEDFDDLPSVSDVRLLDLDTMHEGEELELPPARLRPPRGESSTHLGPLPERRPRADSDVWSTLSGSFEDPSQPEAGGAAEPSHWEAEREPRERSRASPRPASRDPLEEVDEEDANTPDLVIPQALDESDAEEPTASIEIPEGFPPPPPEPPVASRARLRESPPPEPPRAASRGRSPPPPPEPPRPASRNRSTPPPLPQEMAPPAAGLPPMAPRDRSPPAGNLPPMSAREAPPLFGPSPGARAEALLDAPRAPSSRKAPRKEDESALIEILLPGQTPAPLLDPGLLLEVQRSVVVPSPAPPRPAAPPLEEPELPAKTADLPHLSGSGAAELEDAKRKLLAGAVKRGPVQERSRREEEAPPPPARARAVEPKPAPKPAPEVKAAPEPKPAPESRPAQRLEPERRDPRPPAEPVDSVRMLKAQKLFDQALKDKSEGNLVSARMNMKLALTFDPSNALFQNAFDELSKNPEARPVNANVAANRARELYDAATSAENVGDVDKAIDLLEKAIEESKQAAFYNRLGVILAMKKREYDRAQRLVEEALDLSPGNAAYEKNLQKILAMAAAAASGTKGPAKRGGLLGFLGRRK